MRLTTSHNLVTVHQAISLIRNGDTVAIGGYYLYRHPMALVREMVRAGLRDLTIVTPLASIAPDLLIGAGCVKKIIFGFVSLDVLGLAPNFRRRIQDGAVEALEYGDLPLVRSLEAGIRDLPFVPARSLSGTDLLALHPARPIDGEGGEKLISLPPIKPDVMLIHAQWADSEGNLAIEGEGYDIVLLEASRKVVASVERIVGRRELVSLRKSMIPRYAVDALVEVRFGAHPCSCYPWYTHDLWHLLDYDERCRHGRLDEYLDEFVHSPQDHEDYLERVGGVRRLTRLEKLMARGIAMVRGE